jgi:hypothetical protein
VDAATDCPTTRVAGDRASLKCDGTERLKGGGMSELSKTPTCSYGDCTNPCDNLELVDFKGFSDGASTYYVSDYCSHDCLILDFHRAAMDKRNIPGRRKVADIVASFKT